MTFDGVTTKLNQVMVSNFTTPTDGYLFLGNSTNRGLALTGNTYYLPQGDLYLTQTANDVYARYFRGIATSANYADVAEKYLTDQEYSVGTLVKVGGVHEATMVTDSDCYVLGVISDKPAYLMNFESEGQAIALLGRVPVKIKGAVKKGEPLWPATNGCASTISNGREPFAYALADGEDQLVECVIR